MMRKLTILAALCGFLLASCGGGGGAKGDSPTKLFEKMNGYIKDGDYEKAVKFWVDHTDLTGNDQMDSKEEVDKFVTVFADKIKTMVDKHGGVQGFQITEETLSEDGNSAKVVAVMTYKDGTTDDNTTKFKKVDGKWMFDNSK